MADTGDESLQAPGEAEFNAKVAAGVNIFHTLTAKFNPFHQLLLARRAGWSNG
jgi:hypothetical protein